MSIERCATLGKGARRLALFLLVAAADRADAQPDSARSTPRRIGIIDGLVSDSALAPLDDVIVSFVGGTTRIVTGASGRFRFLDVPAGTHRILARRIGNEPVIAEVRVVDGEVVRPAMILLPVVTELRGVRVEGARGSATFQEFEARRKLGHGGYFITQAQIEKRNVVALSDLLVGLPNLLVDRLSAVSRRNPNQMRCPMSVLVDGIPRGTNLADMPSPKELMGLEVYHGPATMPLQYKRWSGAGFCGLILAWTKDGSTP